MRSLDVAIIGAGISGLSTAFYLSRQLPNLSLGLIEPRERCGGLISTSNLDGFLFEEGPDSLVRYKPEGIQLVRDLGLEEDLIPSSPDEAGALLWAYGCLHQFPVGILMRAPIDLNRFANSTLLSESGWKRAIGEPQIPPSQQKDESVHDFFERRFGPEVADMLAAPLVAGVYGGDSRQISLRATFPQLFEAERNRGYVTGVAPESDSRQASPFVSLRGGLGQLIDALVEALSPKCDFIRGEVERIRPLSAGFSLLLSGGSTVSADSVVVATQASVSCKIMNRSFPELADILGRIPYTASLIGCFGFSQDVTSHLSGTGLLVPPSEDPILMAATWVHHKFPGRCRKGGALIRCFLGSQAAAERIRQSDEVLIDALLKALERIVGISVKPKLARIYRWPTGLPQYTTGHLERVYLLLERLQSIDGLYCVGNYFDGVGISDSIRWGKRAVAKIRESRQP